MRAPARGEELLLIDALRRVGARSVRKEGERYVAHFPAFRDPDSLVREAALAIRASTSLRDPDLTWRHATAEEWESHWLKEFRPYRVTDRIVVVPAVERSAPREPVNAGDVVIRLAPGAGFGTAEHATTRGCLRMLERLLRPGDRVADVGTGSGILAVAAALLGAEHVLALESDRLAVETAKRNTALNGVQDRVEIRRRVVVPGDLAASGPFQGILANLETRLLLRLLPDFRAALAPAGWLVLSGVPGDEPRALVRAAREQGLELRDSLVEDGWWTGAFAAAGDGGPAGRGTGT